MYKCDICNSELTEVCYKPHNSRYDVEVYQCSVCSTVQSKKKLKNPKKFKTVSCDADWGNVRHGKSLRLDTLKKIFFKDFNFLDIKTCLDIGSSRGDFVNYAIDENSSLLIDAVEPDSSVIDNYHTTVNIINDRFENVELKNDYYDLIYSCQTLEHASSADDMIRRSKSLLSNKGLMLIDIPSIEIINDEKIIEEFFIDKHTFHFNEETFEYLLAKNGLRVLKKDYNKYNLSVLCCKDSKSSYSYPPKKNIKRLCYQYAKNREQNRKLLKSLVDNKIMPLIKRQKVAFWGASRTLDALVKYGALDLSNAHIIVDSYLHGKIKLHGKYDIKEPSYLKQYEPSIVFVLARSAENDIAKIAYKMGIRHVIKYSEIFEQVIVDSEAS